MPQRGRSWVAVGVVALMACAVSAVAGSRAAGQGDSTLAQAVLGPGLYVFQTRVRGATCKDAEPDGYVLSYFASIDGVPGSRTMTMQLVNTQHFVNWKLEISERGAVDGESRMGSAPDAPETHFQLKLDRDRFTGTGARTYNGKLDGKPQRCVVSYDALLRRIDT